MNTIEKIRDLLAGLSPSTIVVLLLAGTLVLSLISSFVISRLKNSAAKTKTPWDEAFCQSIGAPLHWMLWVAVLSVVINILLGNVNSRVEELADAIRGLGVISAIAWFLIRFINAAQSSVHESRTRSGKKFDLAAFEAIGKISKLVVFVIATLVVMQTLGFSIAGVLTFGGVGGIAIGFAAKDMLSNFFGGLFIYLDRPFAVGDWVRSPDREIEGTVEKIGWRVTLIRKFDSRPLYIPNAVFATISVENPSRMTNREIYETIGIRYDDAKAVALIVEQVTAYLKAHAEIDQDKSLMVNFNEFAPSSLDFFIYCFTKTKAWAEFHRIKQEVLLHVLQIIHDNNAQCAFPTTTLHLQGDLPIEKQVL